VKVSARERKFLIVGGCAVVASALLYFGINLAPGGEGLSKTVEYKKTLLARQREIIAKEDLYKLRIDQYRRRLSQDKTRLLPGDNPSIAGAELQKVLKEIADKNGIEILRKDTQAQKKLQDDLIKISVRVEINCVPDQLIQFLAAVENYEKSLTVDLLAINSFRIQKRYEIRPNITISGYIAGAPEKPAERPAGGQ
jgi:type II secretory pathway component PulM